MKEKQLIIFGAADPGAIIQAKNCLVEAEAVLLMADNHKGYGMPVGGVAVYKHKISPAGVGFDIACGNKAVKLDVKASDVPDWGRIGEEIARTISFGVGRKNKEKIDNDLFDSDLWNIDFHRQNPELKQLAREQLGTVGSGNHYVDVFRDENDSVWIGVHFGSRGLGHKTASHFMRLAGDNTNIMDETPHTLDTRTKNGQDYVAAMTLAGLYAYAGRDWVCRKVASIIGAPITDEVHNHHNFAWEEVHNGETYWVVRKGATPAFPDQRGFVGSSMGDDSVIIHGVDSKRSREAFYSTVHGAGRVMSRTAAAGKVRWKKGRPERVSQGLVDWGTARRDVQSRGTFLFGGGADEAPEVYKKLPEVLAAHEGTLKIETRLKPIIVVMAGADEYDPYKD